MPDAREVRAIVGGGYDAIATTYLRARLELLSEAERAFLGRVLAALPADPLVVDLGCGPGIPFTAALADVAQVIAVDLSASQLRLAREHVPAAHLVRGDMASFALRPASVDVVTAFASIGHVSMDAHRAVYRSIASWLRPGGVFASQHPIGANPEEIDPDWMGAPMYFSHPDLDGTIRLLRAAGFELESVDRVEGREHDGSVSSWAGIVAHLSAGPPGRMRP